MPPGPSHVLKSKTKPLPANKNGLGAQNPQKPKQVQTGPERRESLGTQGGPEKVSPERRREAKSREAQKAQSPAPQSREENPYQTASYGRAPAILHKELWFWDETTFINQIRATSARQVLQLPLVLAAPPLTAPGWQVPGTVTLALLCSNNYN